MSRTWWTLVRLLGGAAIVAFLVQRFGTGPFLDGLRLVDPVSLAAAAGIALLTTVCCAWRWRLVARGLGVGLPMRAAVAAYYRSQFLNTTCRGSAGGRGPGRAARARCGGHRPGSSEWGRLGALRRAGGAARPGR